MKPSPAAVNMLPYASPCKEKGPDYLIKSHMPSKNAHLSMLCNVLFGGPVAQTPSPKHESRGWQRLKGRNTLNC